MRLTKSCLEFRANEANGIPAHQGPKQSLILNLRLTLNRPYRRKFRSGTSDNMESWKSRGGKSQGGEVKK